MAVKKRVRKKPTGSGEFTHFFSDGLQSKKFGSFFHSSVTHTLYKVRPQRFRTNAKINIIKELGGNYAAKKGKVWWSDAYSSKTGKPKDARREKKDEPKHGEKCVVHGKLLDKDGKVLRMKDIAKVDSKYEDEKAFFVTLETAFDPFADSLKAQKHDYFESLKTNTPQWALKGTPANKNMEYATVGIVLPESEYKKVKKMIAKWPNRIIEMMRGIHPELQGIYLPEKVAARMGVIEKKKRLQWVTAPKR